MLLKLAAKIYLPLLLLLPGLAWWEHFLARKGQRHIWFPSQKLFPAATPTLKSVLIRSLFRFKLAALFFFIVALARPQLLNTYAVEEQKGMDILLTLDISGSMAAVDFKPKNRLEVAKEVIASFIEKRRSDRLGLVIFAATSYTKCPLDHGLRHPEIFPARHRARRTGRRHGAGHGPGQFGQPPAAFPGQDQDHHPADRRRQQPRRDRPARRGQDGPRLRHQGLHHRRRHPRRGALPGAGLLRPPAIRHGRRGDRRSPCCRRSPKPPADFISGPPTPVRCEIFSARSTAGKRPASRPGTITRPPSCSPISSPWGCSSCCWSKPPAAPSCAPCPDGERASPALPALYFRKNSTSTWAEMMRRKVTSG